MRTRYVKISTLKSGQATKELSERDQEIYNTFTFLDSHVKRGPSLQSFNFKSRRLENEVVEEESTSSTETSTTETPAEQMSQLDSSGEQSHSNQSLLGTLIARADKIEQLRKSLTNQNVEKTPQDEAVDSFVTYLSTQLRQVNPNDWPDFTVDAIRLIKSYTLRNIHPVINCHSHSTPYHAPLQNVQDFSTPPNHSANIFKQPNGFSDNPASRSASGGLSGNVESDCPTFNSSIVMNYENL